MFLLVELKIILENAFFQRLMNWYDANSRDLPWRSSADPYEIWLSEIILQQTRVEQGLPYFKKFMDNFPNVQALASASEEEVMKCWQGLGYYSRARNLHNTAKYVADVGNGAFPADYKGLLQLKGVGAYTAAAVASFAYGEPVPVVDGNVYRFVARFLGIDMPIGSPKAHGYFSEIAREWMPDSAAGPFNQAMMEFGALHCTPKKPNCLTCPFQVDCIAYRTNRISDFPVKASKTKVKEVFYHFIILDNNSRIAMTQRDDSGLWKKLWHFPLIEASSKLSPKEILEEVSEKFGTASEYLTLKGNWYTTHLLSHRKIQAYFWEINSSNAAKKNDTFGYSLEELEKLPLPQLMVKYLNHKKDVGK